MPRSGRRGRLDVGGGAARSQGQRAGGEHGGDARTPRARTPARGSAVGGGWHRRSLAGHRPGADAPPAHRDRSIRRRWPCRAAPGRRRRRESMLLMVREQRVEVATGRRARSRSACLEMRSVPVWVLQARMLTWCVGQRRATRRAAGGTGRGPCTSIDADERAGAGRSSHSTSISRSRLAGRRATRRWRSRLRCTDTPRPRVTKPMISSPGTGVQQRDRRTMTSSRPSTCTPAPARWPPRRGAARRPWWAAAPRGSGSPLRSRRLTRAATDSGRHVVLADGACRARRGRRSSGRSATSSSTLAPASFCTGRPSRRSALTSSSRPVSRASSRRSRENHWRILLAAPWGADDLQPVLRRARRPRPWT